MVESGGSLCCSATAGVAGVSAAWRPPGFWPAFWADGVADGEGWAGVWGGVATSCAGARLASNRTVSATIRAKRRETGDEEVLRQHEEHVAGEREQERDDEPRPDVAVGGVELLEGADGQQLALAPGAEERDRWVE